MPWDVTVYEQCPRKQSGAEVSVCSVQTGLLSYDERLMSIKRQAQPLCGAVPLRHHEEGFEFALWQTASCLLFTLLVLLSWSWVVPV